MDDFGSVIYVILTIVAIIFSIIRKANKNKPARPFSTEDELSGESEFPDFTTLFQTKEDREEIKGDIVPGVKRVDLPTIEPAKTEPVFVKTDFQKKMEELERNAERNAVKKRQKEVVLIEDTEQESSAGWFNAKDAIIYSEILKRPNF